MLRTSKTHAPSRSRRLFNEALEDRRMLAVITVDTLVDEADGSIVDGDVSLRDAINAANNMIGADTIYFDNSLSGGTIPLDDVLQQLVISDSVTIDARSLEEKLTIDAGHDPEEAFTGDEFRIFFIEDPADDQVVEINGLILTGGYVDDHGGAIRALNEVLILKESVITGNGTVENPGVGSDGGGVSGGLSEDNRTIVTLINTEVSGNQTKDPVSRGGGISAAYVNLTDSRVSGNKTLGPSSPGGGIYTDRSLVVTRSVIENNHTAGSVSYGGGVATPFFGGNGDKIIIMDSTVSGNYTLGASGAPTNRSDGGGIFVGDIYTVEITNSTISGNTTGHPDSRGAGIMVFNPGISPFTSMTIRHSTITNNQALGNGGFAGEGGGIWADDMAYLHLTIDHSIIAGNSDDGTAPDLRYIPAMTMTDVDFSLIGDNSGTNLVEAQTAISPNFNLVGDPNGAGIIDPLLGALADNGGPTNTHALLPGSPAINAGDATAVAGMGGVPSYDQRGSGFDRIVDSTIDMGAYEIAFLPADGNFDGWVDGLDYIIWASNFGTHPGAGSGPANGDFNEDGWVDGLDYLVWAGQLGQHLASPAGQPAAADAILADDDGIDDVSGDIAFSLAARDDSDSVVDTVFEQLLVKKRANKRVG